MNGELALVFTYGIITSIIGIIITPYFIDLLHYFDLKKQIREEALVGKATEFAKLHKKKSGTPTMGGAIILVIVAMMVGGSVLLQYMGYTTNSLFNQKETYLSLFTLFTVGVLGAVDDYMNVRGLGRTKGLGARFKSVWLFTFALLGAMWFFYKLGWNVTDNFGNYIKTLYVPFVGAIEMGIYFIPFFVFIIIAGANSVNITDGLDGLAGGLLLFCYSVYAFITYDQGLYLLSTLCIVIIGALIAFLWYNIKPAKFYMGDVGSYALGANLGIMAMLTNTVFILIIIGIIFIVETLSVIIQISSKKLRKGKKIFRIAPYHHHLEAIGRSEETVVFKFWLIGIISSAVGVIVYLLK